MLRESPPLAVLGLLEHRSADGSPVLFATSADLTLEGAFARHWLLVTRQALTVVAEEPEPRVVCTLPLAEIDTVRAHGVLGSGFLQARVGK